MTTDSWKNPGSYFLMEPTPGGRKQIHSQLAMDGATYVRITGMEQTGRAPGKIRATLTLVSPEDFRPLEAKGDVRMRALETRKRRKANREMKERGEEEGPSDLPLPEGEGDDSTGKGESKKAAVVYARMTTYLKTTDEALCKAEILAKAKKLATKYHASIEGVSRTMPINPELHDMPTLVARHLTDYTKKKELQGREADDTKSRLRTAAAKLYAIPLAEITPERLEKVQKSKEPLTKRQLKALEDYWYYCSDCFVTLQENPFVGASSFRNKKRKTAEEAATSNHLSEEQEADLDRKLLPLIEEDGCVLAIFLAKDGGISGSYCSKLKWKDIKFGADPRNVVIQIHRESAGATQNYSRPVFPTLALALRKRYERLLRDFTEEKLKGQHVIHLNRKKPRPGSKEERTWDEDEEDEPEDDEEDDGLVRAEGSVSAEAVDEEGKKKKKKTRRDRITRYIRETLIAKDVSYEVYLVVEADKDRENAVGTQILLNTYSYKLNNLCGLKENDPTAIMFLKTLSMRRDVTADHYRSFTSPEGQRKLYVALRRADNGVFDMDAEDPTPIPVTGHFCRETGSNRQRATELTAEFLLKPGEHLEIRSPYGIKGRVIAMGTGADADEPAVVLPFSSLQKLPEAIAG